MLHLAGKYLVFNLHSERLAIFLHLVTEIIKPVLVTPIPHSQPSMLGVFNFRGNVTPLYDLLPALVRYDSSAVTDKGRSRFLVLKKEGRIQALRADWVEGIFDIESKELLDAPLEVRGISGSFLLGLADRKDEKGEILLLDPEKVLNAEGRTFDSEPSQWKGAHHGVDAISTISTRKTVSILTFLVGQKEFALQLDTVSELIRLTEQEVVAEAPDYIMGLVVHRDQPLHLVDLFTLLGIAPAPQKNQTDKAGSQLALIIRMSGVIVGLLADEVVEIKEIDEEQLQCDPALLSAFGKEIKAVIEEDGGRRFILLLDQLFLMSILDIDFLIHDSRKKLTDIKVTENTGISSGAKKKFLLFALLSDYYALPIDDMKGIIILNNLTPLPQNKPWISGLSNVRGKVHTVIDLKKILKLRSLSEEAVALTEQVRCFVKEESSHISERKSLKEDSEMNQLENLRQFLMDRRNKKKFGSRACGQLLTCLTGATEIQRSFLEAFEEALFSEVKQLEESPKLLLLNGADPMALLVDSVRSVVDIFEENIELGKNDDAGSDILNPGFFGSFILEENGEKILIPNLRDVLKEPDRVVVT